MTPDQLEFSISQYIDGALAPLEQAALEEMLATDATARALLEEYRKLDALVKRAPAAPAIEWDRLANQICEFVAREPAPAVRSYTMPWVRAFERIAVAASVLLVFALGMISYRSHRHAEPSRAGGPVQVVVFGPQIEPASSPLVQQVAIGPAPAAEETWRYAEGVVARPSVVLIDRAYGPAQDIDPMPY
jgi:negative regulator of sigma E activity